MNSRRFMSHLSAPGCAISIEIYHDARIALRPWKDRKEKPMSAEARLKELGLVLPALAKPVANFLPY